VTEVEECGGGGTTLDPGGVIPDDEFLCLEGDIGESVEDQNGNPVLIDDVADEDDLLGSIERLATTSESWGTGLEAQEKARLFGLRKPVHCRHVLRSRPHELPDVERARRNPAEVRRRRFGLLH
jgi:hypothetical protein